MYMWTCEALSYMHVTMETAIVGVAINYHYAIIWEYIVKRGTEHNSWLLPNLLYKFSWRFHTRKYLEEPVASHSIPAWSQSRIEIKYYSVAYFERITTHFIDVLGIYVFTRRVWAPPLAEAQRYSGSNLVMRSKHATE